MTKSFQIKSELNLDFIYYDPNENYIIAGGGEIIVSDIDQEKSVYKIKNFPKS
jgi:hypothetical protein